MIGRYGFYDSHGDGIMMSRLYSCLCESAHVNGEVVVMVLMKL